MLTYFLSSVFFFSFGGEGRHCYSYSLIVIVLFLLFIFFIVIYIIFIIFIFSIIIVIIIIIIIIITIVICNYYNLLLLFFRLNLQKQFVFRVSVFLVLSPAHNMIIFFALKQSNNKKYPFPRNFNTSWSKLWTKEEDGFEASVSFSFSLGVCFIFCDLFLYSYIFDILMRTLMVSVTSHCCFPGLDEDPPY